MKALKEMFQDLCCLISFLFPQNDKLKECVVLIRKCEIGKQTKILLNACKWREW